MHFKCGGKCHRYRRGSELETHVVHLRLEDPIAGPCKPGISLGPLVDTWDRGQESNTDNNLIMIIRSLKYLTNPNSSHLGAADGTFI